MRFPVRIIAAVLFASAASSLLAKPPAPPPTAPGKYQGWNNGEIDQVEILQPFHLKDYKTIEVLPSDISALPVPTGGDSRDDVRGTLAGAASSVSDELEDNLPGKWKLRVEPLPAGVVNAPQSLELRTKLISYSPGTRRTKEAAATGSRLVFAGELVDPATKKPLLRFTIHNDGKRGDYKERFENNLEAAMKRVAKLIKAFYP